MSVDHAADRGGGPRGGRRRLAALLAGGVALLLLSAVDAAARWAIVARPVAMAGPTTPGTTPPLPPDLAGLVAFGQAISREQRAALQRIAATVPMAYWVDVDALLVDDPALDDRFLDERQLATMDAAARADVRAALRTVARELAAAIAALGLPEGAVDLAAAAEADAAPLPVDLEPPPIAASNQLRELGRAAMAMARVAVRGGDVDGAVAWLDTARIAADAALRLPSVIDLLSGSAMHQLLRRTARELVAEARTLPDGEARRLLAGIEGVLAARSFLPPAGRWATLERHRLDALVREMSDARGRLLPAWTGWMPGTPVPSVARRLRLNLPALLMPTRAELLQRAEPRLEWMASWRAVVPLPDLPHAPAKTFTEPLEWPPSAAELGAQRVLQDAFDDLARGHRALARATAADLVGTAGLRVTLAVERHRLDHGASPPSLGVLSLPPEALVDPWTGGRFGYAPGDPAARDRWRLWSAGPDRTDDGGRTSGPGASDVPLHPRAFDETEDDRR